MYKGFPSREEYQKWLGDEISRIYAEIEASHPGIFDGEEYCRPTKRAVDPPSALECSCDFSENPWHNAGCPLAGMKAGN